MFTDPHGFVGRYSVTVYKTDLYESPSDAGTEDGRSSETGIFCPCVTEVPRLTTGTDLVCEGYQCTLIYLI